MCIELAALGIEVNDEKTGRFVRATKLWGEELASLRHTQIDSVVLGARDEARAQYDLQAMIEAGRIP